MIWGSAACSAPTLGAASSLHPTSRQKSLRKSPSQDGRGQLQKPIIHGSLARPPNCAIGAWGRALVAEPVQAWPLKRWASVGSSLNGGAVGNLGSTPRASPLPALPPILSTRQMLAGRDGEIRSSDLFFHTIHLAALPSLRRVSAGARTIPVRRLPRLSRIGNGEAWHPRKQRESVVSLASGVPEATPAQVWSDAPPRTRIVELRRSTGCACPQSSPSTGVHKSEVLSEMHDRVRLICCGGTAASAANAMPSGCGTDGQAEHAQALRDSRLRKRKPPKMSPGHQLFRAIRLCVPSGDVCWGQMPRELGNRSSGQLAKGRDWCV